jgi:hypothetical protein
MLELAPQVADVFAGDSTTVDEYLAQIQEMTILTAIQARGGARRGGVGGWAGVGCGRLERGLAGAVPSKAPGLDEASRRADRAAHDALLLTAPPPPSGPPPRRRSRTLSCRLSGSWTTRWRATGRPTRGASWGRSRPTPGWAAQVGRRGRGRGQGWVDRAVGRGRRRLARRPAAAGACLCSPRALPLCRRRRRRRGPAVVRHRGPAPGRDARAARDRQGAGLHPGGGKAMGEAERAPSHRSRRAGERRRRPPLHSSTPTRAPAAGACAVHQRSSSASTRARRATKSSTPSRNWARRAPPTRTAPVSRPRRGARCGCHLPPLVVQPGGRAPPPFPASLLDRASLTLFLSRGRVHGDEQRVGAAGGHPGARAVRRGGRGGELGRPQDDPHACAGQDTCPRRPRPLTVPSALPPPSQGEGHLAV